MKFLNANTIHAKILCKILIALNLIFISQALFAGSKECRIRDLSKAYLTTTPVWKTEYYFWDVFKLAPEVVEYLVLNKLSNEVTLENVGALLSQCNFNLKHSASEIFEKLQFVMSRLAGRAYTDLCMRRDISSRGLLEVSSFSGIFAETCMGANHEQKLPKNLLRKEMLLQDDFSRMMYCSLNPSENECAGVSALTEDFLISDDGRYFTSEEEHYLRARMFEYGYL
ncbi:MAG: hypothetical protein ABL927_05640 [Bdellovibrionales bacterium]